MKLTLWTECRGLSFDMVARTALVVMLGLALVASSLAV
jgi:hypothetical protein